MAKMLSNPENRSNIGTVTMAIGTSNSLISRKLDQNSHILWGKHEEELVKTYRAVDAAVGEVMQREPDAALIVMSDHKYAVTEEGAEPGARRSRPRAGGHPIRPGGTQSASPPRSETHVDIRKPILKISPRSS